MEQTTSNKKMTKDQIIKELIELLNQSQQREAANNVFEMAEYIDGMEQKVDAVLHELGNVRKQLEEMESRQERKTLKQTLLDSVEKLGQQCQKMKQQIFDVKEEVRAKAAGIVMEAKQKGKSALDKVSEFLGIKNKLQNISQNVQESIAEVDKSIEKIDAFGTGMREAGRKIANTFRIFAGKPEKEYGQKKFSKTELVKKAFQAKRKLLSGILGYADAAIEKTELLALEVKQYRMDKAANESGHTGTEEPLKPPEYAVVAEQEYQYGAEAFEEYQRENTDKTTDILKKGNEVEKDMQRKSLQR